MKKFWIISGVMIVSVVLSAESVRAQLGIASIIKAGITKAIKAVDLKIQRLQNKTILLQNAQKVIENAMSSLRLGEIADWVEKQRLLYKNYYEELASVKRAISGYHRVRDLTRKQLQLVAACKESFARCSIDKHFTNTELNYMEKVYSGILEKSLENLDEVLAVLGSSSFRMSDEARLETIDQAADAIDKNYNDLARFNDNNRLLSLQRSKDREDLETVRSLYGLP